MEQWITALEKWSLIHQSIITLTGVAGFLFDFMDLMNFEHASQNWEEDPD